MLINRSSTPFTNSKILPQRIGEAWEHAPTYFGWTKIAVIDLVNHTTKQAVEVKNSYKTTNAKSKKQIYRDLLDYKRIHPDYEVIFAVINDKVPKDVRRKDGQIRYVSCEYAFRLLFGENTPRVKQVMQNLVNQFLTDSGLDSTECEENA